MLIDVGMKPLPNAAKIAKDLRGAIEKSLTLLGTFGHFPSARSDCAWLCAVPLLSTNNYLPPSLGLGFGELAHGHLHQVLHTFDYTGF